MDLPLITGDEQEHAPHVAITGSPWPGSVAVYQSLSEADFALNSIVAARSSIGFTETPLPRGHAGLIDRGAPLEVKMIHGTLASTTDAALLNGSNLVAIGDGSPDNWELIQFRDAELIAPERYLLSHRIRGQLGSNGVGPDTWPAGSWFVVMDGVPSQIELGRNLRRISQTFRIGPARRSYDDPSYEEFVHAFEGNGLRPYAPVHVNYLKTGSDIRFDWIRRTRIDGDAWDLAEVPLGEETEAYTVRVLQSDQVVREVTVTKPTWVYENSDLRSDGISGAFQVSIAQNSARFGPGIFRTIGVDG
ncbi:GTA baseplate fiber-binding domain-containing protein [Tateyamaria pelophila]